MRDELTGVESLLLVDASHQLFFGDPRWLFVQEDDDHSHNFPEQIKRKVAQISAQPATTVVGREYAVFPTGRGRALSAFREHDVATAAGFFLTTYFNPTSA